MRGPAADDLAVLHVAGARSSLLAPTSLDRLLDRAQRGAPQLARASQALLVGAAALLALGDIAVWATDPVVDTGRISVSTAFLVPCLGALATVAIALRGQRLASMLVVVAAAGLTLTIASWIVGSSLPPSLAALFALALLTSGVLRHEPGRIAILLTALAALSVAAEALRPMVSSAAYLLILCEAAFAVSVGLGVYLRWSDWRRLAAADAARTDERLEIAREMHDMVGHYVTGIVVQAQAARHVADHQPAAAASALESIETAGVEAMAAMRQMVRGLRGNPSITPAGTWDDVESLIAEAVARGEPIRGTIDAEVRGMAPTLAPSVHRIVAESLTNIRRHAREVTQVDVDVTRAEDRLLVTVHDDGQPTIPLVHETFGVVGMRERVESLGGSLYAGPGPTGGWSVRAELPVEPSR